MSAEQPKTLACPRCEQQLRRVRVPIEQASAIIEVCYGGCGGLWLGPEDLAAGLTLTGSDCLLDLQVAASGPGASRWEMLELTAGACPARAVVDLEKWLNCIYCSRGMLRYRWNGTSQVVLDECPSGCGIWVDGGEIQAMRQFQQAENLAPEKATQIRERMDTLSREVRRAPRGEGHRGGLLDLLLEVLGTPVGRL